jgi:hypothetical protein
MIISLLLSFLEALGEEGDSTLSFGICIGKREACS